MIPANAFDPAQYASVRLPALEAHTLPTWCYTSQEFYDREVDRMFKRVWNFVGREDELPNVGDYVAIDLFGEDILLIRGRDDKVRAFANTCRHRGTRLLDGTGNCRAIVCPYHSWSYAFDGELIGCAGMEKTVGFDKAEYGLFPVRLESWGGFMFVCFDDSAGSLADHLGNLTDVLQSHDMSNMVCVRRKEYELTCNWKVYLENAMEEYHTPTVHRQSIGAQSTVREESRGEWDGVFMPMEHTSALLDSDLDDAFPQIPTLDDHASMGTFFLVIYPMTFFAVTQDCMWWLQQFPSAPDRTKVVIGSCFPRQTVELPDFPERVQKYFRRWDKSLPEDNAISERQQLGLRSSFSKPGRLSFHEPVVRDIANWMLDRVIG